MPWLQIRGDVSRGQGCWGKEVRQGERKASVATWKLRNTTARTALSAWKTSARPPGLPLKPLLWGTGPAQFTGTTSSPDQASGLPQGLQMPPHWAALCAAGAPGPPALSSLPSVAAPSLLCVLAAPNPAPRPTALCVLFSNSISHSSPTHPRPFHCVFRNSCTSVGTFKPYFPPVWVLSEL